MYFVNWNIINFNVLIYFIIFVYAMISCGKYHEMSLFFVDLLLATLQFLTTPYSIVLLNRQCFYLVEIYWYHLRKNSK